MITGFWTEDVQERDTLKDLGINMRIILKQLLKAKNEMAWNGFIWCKIQAIGGT